MEEEEAKEDEDFFRLEENLILREKRTIEKSERKKYKASFGESQKRGRRTINALIQIEGSARG